MKDQRSIQQAFERYQSERAIFASSISEFAKFEANFDLIEELGGHLLLLNLLQDPVVSIQINAILALGRFASQSRKFSKSLFLTSTVQHLVSLLSLPVSDDDVKNSAHKETSSLKRVTASALRAIARHDGDSATFIAKSGAVDAIVGCLHRSKEADVKESAVWLLDCLISQDAETAAAVVNAGELQNLVSCLHAPELGLKRAAVSTLGSIAQHSEQLASAVEQSEALPGILSILTSMTETVDLRITRSCLSAISHIIQESREGLLTLAHFASALPIIAEYLTSPDYALQRLAATIIEHVTRHDEALNELLASNTNCVAYLVQGVQSQTGAGGLHFISSIGYICGKNDTLADMVISAGGLHELTVALAHNDQGDIKIAAAWALAKAASHGPQQAQAVAESGALLAMHAIGQVENADNKLISNCNEAASSIIGKLESIPALIALLGMSSSSFITPTMERLYQILSQDKGPTKATFVQSGGLQLILEMSEDPRSILHGNASKLAAVFPQELVNRYSPAYNRAILEKLASGYDDNAMATSTASETDITCATSQEIQTEEVSPSQDLTNDCTTTLHYEATETSSEGDKMENNENLSEPIGVDESSHDLTESDEQ